MRDLIKRADVIKAIEELRKEPHWLHDGDDYRVCGLSEAEDAIERLPSADRPQGEWIDRSGGIEGAWNYCSVCGEQAIDLYDYCPNCGARMRGTRDEAD